MEAPKRRKRKNRLVYILLFLIGFYALFTVVDQQIRLYKLSKQEEAYKNKIAELKQTVAQLEDELNQGDSPEYIEKIAREQLKMVKPNEMIYIDTGKDQLDQKIKAE
ncbi:MAG: FtsB family cell division protein [Bacillota bacterium]